jgi:hypothetical protein
LDHLQLPVYVFIALLVNQTLTHTVKVSPKTFTYIYRLSTRHKLCAAIIIAQQASPPSAWCGPVKNIIFHHQTTINMKFHLLSLALLVGISATAQQASDLYDKKYRRWGAVLGTATYQAESSPDNLYPWKTPQSLNVGAVFNALQYKGLNLRAGAVWNTWRKVMHIDRFNANGVRTGWEHTDMRMNLIRLPVELEYYIPLGKQLYLVPMAGVDGQFFLFGPPSSRSISRLSSGTTQSESTIQQGAPSRFNTSGRIGVSVAVTTKVALLSLGVHHSRQFNGNLFEGSYSQSLNGVSNSGWQRYTGQWWGIGLTIVPKKK